MPFTIKITWICGQRDVSYPFLKKAILVKRKTIEILPVLRRNQKLQTLECVHDNPPAVLLFVDFSKAFDSIRREKMRQTLLAYKIPKGTVNKDSKAMVRSPDGDTDFFEGIAGVLQGDTFVLYIFIICLNYIWLVHQCQEVRIYERKLSRSNTYKNR